LEKVAAELNGKGNAQVLKKKSQRFSDNDMDKMSSQENVEGRNSSLQDHLSNDGSIRDDFSATLCVPNAAPTSQSAIQKPNTMAQGKPEFRSRIPRPNKKKGTSSRSHNSQPMKDQLKECFSESKPFVSPVEEVVVRGSSVFNGAQRSNNTTHLLYENESDKDYQVEQKGSSSTSLPYQRVLQPLQSPAILTPEECLQNSLSEAPQTRDISLGGSSLDEPNVIRFSKHAKNDSKEHFSQGTESSVSSGSISGSTKKGSTFLVQDDAKSSATNLLQSKSVEHHQPISKDKETLSNEMCPTLIQTLPKLDSAYNTMICSSEEESGPKGKLVQRGDCFVKESPFRSSLPIQTSTVNMSHCTFHNSKIQADSHCARPPLTQVGGACCTLCQDKTTCSRTGGHECYSIEKAQSSLSNLQLSDGRYVKDVPTSCCSPPASVGRQSSSNCGLCDNAATGSMQGLPLVLSGGSTSSWGIQSTKTITMDEQVIDEDVLTEKCPSSDGSLANQNQPISNEMEYNRESTLSDEKGSMSVVREYSTDSNSMHFKTSSLASSHSFSSAASVGNLVEPAISSCSSIVKSDSKEMLHSKPILSSAYLDALKMELTRLRRQVSKPHVVSKCSSMTSLPLFSKGSSTYAKSIASTPSKLHTSRDPGESGLRGVKSTPNLSFNSGSNNEGPLFNRDGGSRNYVSKIHESPPSFKDSYNSGNHSCNSSSAEHHGSSTFLSSSSSNKSLASFVKSGDSDLFHKGSFNYVSPNNSSAVTSSIGSSFAEGHARSQTSQASSTQSSPLLKEKQCFDLGTDQSHSSMLSPGSKSNIKLLTPLSGSAGHLLTSNMKSSNSESENRLCTPVKSPVHAVFQHTLTDTLPRDQTSCSFSVCSTPMKMPVFQDCQIYTPEGSPGHGALQLSEKSVPINDELKSSSLISMHTYQLRNPSIQPPWSPSSGVQSQWSVKITADDAHYSSQPTSSPLASHRQPTSSHHGSADQLSSTSQIGMGSQVGYLSWSHFESGNHLGSICKSHFEPGIQGEFSSLFSSHLPTQCTSHPSSLSGGSQAPLSSNSCSQQGSPFFTAAVSPTDGENFSACTKLSDSPPHMALQAPPSSPQLSLSNYPSSFTMENGKMRNEECISNTTCGDFRSPNSGYSNSTALQTQLVSCTDVMSASTSEISAQIHQDHGSGILSLSTAVTSPKTESGSYYRPLQDFQHTPPLNSPIRLSIKGIQSDTSTAGTTSIHKTGSPVLHSQGKLHQKETTTHIESHHRLCLNTISEGMENLSTSEASTQSFKDSKQGSQGTGQYNSSVSDHFDTFQLSNSSCFPVSERSTITSFDRGPKPPRDDPSKYYSMQTSPNRIGNQSISLRTVYSPINSNSTIDDNLSSQGSMSPRNFRESTRTSSQSLCTPKVTDSPKQISQPAMALSQSNGIPDSVELSHSGRATPLINSVLTPNNSYSGRRTPSWTKPYTFSQDTLQNFSPLSTPTHKPHIWLQKCSPVFSSGTQASLPNYDQSPVLVKTPSQNTEAYKNDILEELHNTLLSNNPESNEENELNASCSQLPNSICEELDSPTTPNMYDIIEADCSLHSSSRNGSEFSSLEDLEKLLEKETLESMLEDETGNKEEFEELLGPNTANCEDCGSSNTSNEDETNINETCSIGSQYDLDDVLTSPSFSLRMNSRYLPTDAPSFWEKGFSTPHSSDKNVQFIGSHASVNGWNETSNQEGSFLEGRPNDHISTSSFSDSKDVRSENLEHTGHIHHCKSRHSPLKSAHSASSQSHHTSNIATPPQEPVISTDHIVKRKVSTVKARQSHYDWSEQSASFNTKSDSAQLYVPPLQTNSNTRRENNRTRGQVGRSRSDKYYKCVSSGCTSTSVCSEKHSPEFVSFDHQSGPHFKSNNSRSTWVRPSGLVQDHKFPTVYQREGVECDTPGNYATRRSSIQQGHLRSSHFSSRRNVFTQQKVDNPEQFPYCKEQRRIRVGESSHKRNEHYCHELHRKRKHPGKVRLIKYNKCHSKINTYD